MNVKELKTRYLRGQAYPPLFDLPVDSDSNAFILKIEVFADGGKAYIGCGTYNLGSFTYKYYPYINMEQEYEATGKINVRPIQRALDFKMGIPIKFDNGNEMIYNTPISNLVLKNPDNCLITNDIDYFRAYDDPKLKITDKKLIYSKLYSKKPWGGTIDWGDGNIETLNDLIEDYENEFYSCKYVRGSKKHIYKKAGEYTIKIYGHIPSIALSISGFSETDNTTSYWFNALPKEIVSFGKLGLYELGGSFISFDSEFSSNKKLAELQKTFKFPSHIPFGTFDNVLYTGYSFRGIKQDNNLPQEIFSFTKMFPNVISAMWMFNGSYVNNIPDNFCNGHKNLMYCQGMFDNTHVKKIGNYAFANCELLTDIDNLIRNDSTQDELAQCSLNEIGNYVFENDINLVDIDWAFNYCSDRDIYKYPDKGLEKVGDGVFKNCKRLRQAKQPFYQESRLKTVGIDLFAGCEDLIDVTMCFFFCRSLKTIGEGIFKGCSKVRFFMDFFYYDFMVDYPDNMLIDVKYYDYLSEFGFDFRYFNYQFTMGENDSYGANEHLMLCYEGYDPNDITTVPKRKACEHMFSDEFIMDAIARGKKLFTNESLHTLLTNIIQLQQRKKITNSNGEVVLLERNFKITPFIGKIFDITKYPGYEVLFEGYYGLYGAQNMEVYRPGYDEDGNYGMNLESKHINLLENYLELVNKDPFIKRYDYDNPNTEEIEWSSYKVPWLFHSEWTPSYNFPLNAMGEQGGIFGEGLTLVDADSV